MSFDLEAVGQHQPWVVHHRGLEYRGEVIIAESVDPAWGEPLEGDISFRLVFFTVPRRISPGRIQDTRIAMVVPGRPPTQERQSLGRELKSIQETRERYITGQNSDTQALRRSMEDREESLRQELERRYGMAYSQGRIYTHSDIRVRARDIFIEGGLETWADLMVSDVLLLAHPSVPFDYGDFPRSLTSGDIVGMYPGLFQGAQDAQALVSDFGPGMGVTSPDLPNMFDVSNCIPIPIIEKALVEARGEMPAQDPVRLLQYQYGLTQTLALFYVMVFIRHSRAEARLKPEHQVESSRGGPFLSDRITWDLVPEVVFSEGMLEQMDTIRLQPASAWNTVLPYATLLVDDLHPSDDEADVALQEQHLVEALQVMAPSIDSAKESLDALEQALGARPLGASTALERLDKLSASPDYREFQRVLQENFQGPAGLESALTLYRQVQRMSALIPEVVRVKDYLEQMVFGSHNQALAFERDSLAARIEPDSLVANPNLWGSIQESLRQFRTRYDAAYRSHHARYHQEAHELRNRLERLRPQVDALARFNDIPELGPPVGEEVQQMFKDVSASYTMCPITEDALRLDDVPHCQSCLLTLDVEIPRRDVEVLFGNTETAIREYNRRLSSHSIRQILAHPTREQLDKFVNLVQVADPSALANVLDDDVVEFLRSFLREG